MTTAGTTTETPSSTATDWTAVSEFDRYVAMEHVPGQDLDQEIKSGKTFTLEEILEIMEDISQASSHLQRV